MYIMDEGYGTEGYVNYPQAISDVFPGLPPNVDAATVWTGNNKLYFFKGNTVFCLPIQLNYVQIYTVL